MVCVASLMCFSLSVRAQSNLGTLTGVVTDPAGAVVPNAQITLSGPDGFSKEAAPDAQGRFAVAGPADLRRRDALKYHDLLGDRRPGHHALEQLRQR